MYYNTCVRYRSSSDKRFVSAREKGEEQEGRGEVPSRSHQSQRGRDAACYICNKQPNGRNGVSTSPQVLKLFFSETPLLFSLVNKTYH